MSAPNVKKGEKRLPFMRFFTRDWRSNPDLRGCSLAARGLCLELLTLMHEADPRGVLAIDLSKLHLIVGAEKREVARLLKELDNAGIFRRNEQGAIYSDRMRRECKETERAREWGRTGGNPQLKTNLKRATRAPDAAPHNHNATKPDNERDGEGVNPKDKGTPSRGVEPPDNEGRTNDDKPRHKLQSPESRISESRISASSSASAQTTPDDDELRKLLTEAAKGNVRPDSRNLKPIRRLVAKYGLAIVLQAVRETVASSPSPLRTWGAGFIGEQIELILEERRSSASGSTPVAGVFVAKTSPAWPKLAERYRKLQGRDPPETTENGVVGLLFPLTWFDADELAAVAHVEAAE